MRTVSNWRGDKMAVGRAFARFCSMEEAAVAELGSLTFDTVFDEVSALLQSTEIEFDETE